MCYSVQKSQQKTYILYLPNITMFCKEWGSNLMSSSSSILLRHIVYRFWKLIHERGSPQPVFPKSNLFIVPQKWSCRVFWVFVIWGSSKEYFSFTTLLHRALLSLLDLHNHYIIGLSLYVFKSFTPGPLYLLSAATPFTRLTFFCLFPCQRILFVSLFNLSMNKVGERSRRIV